MLELYPFLFESNLVSRIWGGDYLESIKKISSRVGKIGESWEISALPGNESTISNGTFVGMKLTDMVKQYPISILGKNVVEKFGNSFPLLIKLIDACDDLSIQVHPNDNQARELDLPCGKTECWYVLKSENEALIYLGFNKNIDKSEFYRLIESNTICDYIKVYSVKKGDLFFVPSGTVHALGSGVVVAEIQQSSDTTFRIYDYNRRESDGSFRTLHVDEASNVLNFSICNDLAVNFKSITNCVESFSSCSYFTVNRIYTDSEILLDRKSLESFVVYMSIEGDAEITAGGSSIILPQSYTCLIPSEIASINIRSVSNNRIELLEIYID